MSGLLSDLTDDRVPPVDVGLMPKEGILVSGLAQLL
jgi:hypothetical protein